MGQPKQVFGYTKLGPPPPLLAPMGVVVPMPVGSWGGSIVSSGGNQLASSSRGPILDILGLFENSDFERWVHLFAAGKNSLVFLRFSLFNTYEHNKETKKNRLNFKRLMGGQNFSVGA